jgi:hypothetical protein
VDAFAGRTYPGKVASVSKLSRPISNRSPVKYFEASIKLDTPDPQRLRPGMEGEADIAVGGSGAEALIIPRAAVRGEGKDSYVLVDHGTGEAEKSPVTLGDGDLVRVAVLSGVSEGDRVLIGEGTIPGTGSVEEGVAGSGGASATPPRSRRPGGGVRRH